MAPTSPIPWTSTRSSSRRAARPAHPLRVLETAEDWAWWRERFANTMHAAGLSLERPGRSRLLLRTARAVLGGEGGSEEIGALGVSLGGMGSVQRLQTIAEVEATTLWCTPTYALHLLEVAVEQRLESAFDSLERVLCTGSRGDRSRASVPGSRRGSAPSASITPDSRRPDPSATLSGGPRAARGRERVRLRDPRRGHEPDRPGRAGRAVITPLRLPASRRFDTAPATR